MQQQRESWIELHKENMKFSAGHFTVFSATERENLHGHNYNVYVGLKVSFDHNGMAFDYRTYKQKIYLLCKQLNQTCLLPSDSKFLTITEDETYFKVLFAAETLFFLKRDVTLLPMTNITVEELSAWFVDKLCADQAELQRNCVTAIVVKVFSGPGQSGSAQWESSQ